MIIGIIVEIIIEFVFVCLLVDIGWVEMISGSFVYKVINSVLCSVFNIRLVVIEKIRLWFVELVFGVLSEELSNDKWEGEVE